MTTTPTSGAADLPEALKHAEGLESFAEHLPAYGFDSKQLKEAAATIRRLHALLEAEDAAHCNTIEQRDEAEKLGTMLANAVAEHFRVEVGEYSNLNDPRIVALEILDGGYITDSDADRKIAALAAGQATAAQQAPAGVTLRSMIEGMSVSVDVSTGDHDAGHRYFGTVTEVMECQGDKHGVTLLVQDAEPNFAVPTPQAAQTAPAAQQAGERVYAFRRKGLDDFCTCDEARYEELSNKPHLFETRVFYTAPQPSHGQAPAQPDQPIACSYGDNGYACCEGGPCQADVHNDKLAEQQAPATAQAADSVPAPAPPPECETEAEKRAFAFGWFRALESERMKAESVQEDAARAAQKEKP